MFREDCNWGSCRNVVFVPTVAGPLIIRAICEGENDPQKLAALCQGNCRISEEEIAKAVQSNGRKDYHSALRQELETYDQTQEKINRCDIETEKMLNEIILSDDNKRQHHLEPKKHKRVNKNSPKDIDLNLKAYQLFEGTGLLAIGG
jgi:transposase